MIANLCIRSQWVYNQAAFTNRCVGYMYVGKEHVKWVELEMGKWEIRMGSIKNTD